MLAYEPRKTNNEAENRFAERILRLRGRMGNWRASPRKQAETRRGRTASPPASWDAITSPGHHCLQVQSPRQERPKSQSYSTGLPLQLPRDGKGGSWPSELLLPHWRGLPNGRVAWMQEHGKVTEVTAVSGLDLRTTVPCRFSPLFIRSSSTIMASDANSRVPPVV